MSPKSQPQEPPAPEAARVESLRLDDDRLVERARKADADAFAQLMRRHERLVFKVAIGFTHDRDAAFDVLQNAFLKAFRGLDRYTTGGHFRAWLLRITTNEAISWKRRQGRHQGHLPVEGLVEIANDDDPDLDYRRREQHERLLDGLEDLRPRYRTALSMRYFQGLKLREIAEVLDCSENVVKQLLFRGVRALRDTVAQQA